MDQQQDPRANFFDDWSKVNAKVLFFEERERGLKLKCEVIDGPRKGRTFYNYIPNNSDPRDQLLLCIWTEAELNDGVHKRDGNINKITNAKLTMQAQTPYESRYDNRWYQSFRNFTVYIDPSS